MDITRLEIAIPLLRLTERVGLDEKSVWEKQSVQLVSQTKQSNSHFLVHFHVVLLQQLVVRIRVVRLKLVASEDEEDQRGRMLEQCLQPLVLERHGYFDQVHDDAREVNVEHNQHVELAEQLQLLQADRRLAIRLRRLLQVANGPDHGKQNGATTQQIDQNEYLPPDRVDESTLLRLFTYDVRYVGNDLGQRGKRIE